jgi:phosphoribosylamine--glycine ligase
MKTINALIIGSGGREYALAWKISQSKHINKFFSINGSDGIKKFAKLLPTNWKNFEDVLKICRKEEIDLVVIGPEEPLVLGLSDFLRSHNINVFGPSQEGAKIESSKKFTKILCDEMKIPTAKYESFDDLEKLSNYIKQQKKFPIVLKYDGLAAGKGVKISNDLPNALNDAKELFNSYTSNFKIVVEEFLEGHELSFFAITDGNVTKKLAVAQDHKRAYDEDKGENTGGMGVISGNFLINSELEKKIMTQIIEPTIQYFKKHNISYRGVLFAGLMIDKNNNPHLIEYNARFGDPETEAICMRIEDDILELMYKASIEKLDNKEIKISNKTAICVVLASNGYPGEYKKNIPLGKLPKCSKHSKIFHHGTTLKDKEWHSNGGRVLSINILGDSVQEIRKKAYDKLKKINWSEGFYRSDIGKKHE